MKGGNFTQDTGGGGESLPQQNASYTVNGSLYQMVGQSTGPIEPGFLSI